MQVSIETTTGLERRLTVTVPFERFEAQINARIVETAKNVRIPGFRPGRVPVAEVKRRFGVNIRAQIISDTMQTSFSEAVRQEQLRPAASPSFELASPEVVERPGDDLRYTAVFEILPEVALRSFGEIKVERPISAVTEGDIDRMITRLREQRKRFVATSDRVAEKGDELSLDFVGSIDEEPFEGGTAQKFNLELGAGRMIPGFEDSLVGVRASDQRKFPVVFPEDYGNATLRGKTAEFAVTVNEVRVPQMPDVDDEFFASFGVTDGGENKFRAEIRESMERELETAVRQRVKQQVLEGLGSIHTLQLPNALVMAEIGRMRQDTAQRMGIPAEMLQQSDGHNHAHDHADDHAHDHNHAHGDDHDHDHAHDHDHGDHTHDHDHGHAEPSTAQRMNMLPDELFREAAERRVRIGLVMAEIIRQRALQPEAERVRAMIRRMAAAYDDPEQVANWYYGNEEQLSRVEQVALEEQVVDLITTEAIVTDVTRAYDEVITPAQQSASGSSVP